MNLRTLVASALLATGIGLAADSAQAMPVNAPGLAFDTSLVQEAAYGCGAGWTRGPYGYCRPLYACPPGWHSGPYGYHCFRNSYYRPHFYGGYAWGWHPHRWGRWHRW